MSRVIFIQCSNKDCDHKPYPVDEYNLDMLTKCPNCDPVSHRRANRAKQELRKLSNEPKGQRLDVGKVQSLEDGGLMLDDLPGEEIETEPEKYVAPETAEIPVITAKQAKAQATKAKRGKKK